MSVYLDLAFLVNFLFDAEILCLSHFICSEKIRPFRIFLAAFMGGIEGVLVFFPFFDALSLPSVNFFVSLLIAAIASAPCKIGKFITFYIIFVSASFFIAGFMVFAHAGVFWGILLAMPVYFAIAKIKSEIFLKRTKAVLYYGGKRIERQALYDSGNSVTYLGKPVIFGNRALIPEFLGDESLENCEKICIIPYKSAGKSGTVLGIRLDKAVVCGKAFDGAVLGFFDEGFKDEIILNGTMMWKGQKNALFVGKTDKSLLWRK